MITGAFSGFSLFFRQTCASKIAHQVLKTKKSKIMIHYYAIFILSRSNRFRNFIKTSFPSCTNKKCMYDRLLTARADVKGGCN